VGFAGSPPAWENVETRGSVCSLALKIMRNALKAGSSKRSVFEKNLVGSSLVGETVNSSRKVKRGVS